MELRVLLFCSIGRPKLCKTLRLRTKYLTVFVTEGRVMMKLGISRYLVEYFWRPNLMRIPSYIAGQYDFNRCELVKQRRCTRPWDG